jgi:hypothetical protein
MGETSRPGAPGAATSPAPDTWRDNVRLGMLNMAALIAPPVVTVAFALRAGPRSWLDDAALAATGLLLPFYRFMRGSLALRSLLMIATSCVTSIYLMGRIGLTAGLSVSLATFAVLALICASRPAGLTIVALTALAYFSIGMLASRHVLTLTPADTDPYRLRNWIRMGTSASLLSLLLMSVIDFVIRHVESNARAANQALVRLQRATAERAAQETDLRLAYLRLGQLHQKLEATKEEERRGHARGAGRERAHRADRAGRRSHLAGTQDLRRSAPPAPRRGRARLCAARLPREPGGRLGAGHRSRGQ